MIRAADFLGLSARGIRAPIEVLGAVPTPAVAHLVDPNGWTHFVVIYSIRRDSVLIMDPAGGEIRRVSVNEFGKRWTGVILLVAPRGTTATGSVTGSSPAGRFWRLVRPHRRVMIQAVLGAIAYTVLGLSTAVFVQKIVDNVIPAGNRDLLDLLSIGMAAVVAAQAYLRCVRDMLVLRTGQQLDAGLLHGYYQHLLQLPQRFFETMRVGEIVSRLNDAVKIRVFLNEISLELVVNALVVLFSFALMLLYSVQLAALVAGSIPLYLGVYWGTNGVNRRVQRRTMEAAAELEAHVVESVGAAATIHSLGIERHAILEAEKRLVRLLRPVYGVGQAAIFSGAAAELISRAATIALLWFGAVLVLRLQLTPGELMSFYALNGHLTAPVVGLIAANRQVQDALIAADRLFEVLELERERDGGVVTLQRGSFDAIRFRDVHFRYGSRPPLFKGLNLEIEKGRHTAIVGESGSGKSTLAALIQRLHRPESGRILIGAIDIRYVRRESLLRSVALVPQEVVLFTGSLLDNIAAGEQEPDLPRVMRILEQLGLTELEESLPAGLETPLGERGYALSGGQRQRIAIARAMYRSPDVLVLDEATSGLDPATEVIVKQTLHRLQSEGMTIVMITHRLSCALAADQILVLEKGRLAEQGTHRELLDRRGPYCRLWGSQTGAGSPGPGVPLSASSPMPR